MMVEFIRTLNQGRIIILICIFFSIAASIILEVAYPLRYTSSQTIILGKYYSIASQERNFLPVLVDFENADVLIQKFILFNKINLDNLEDCKENGLSFANNLQLQNKTLGNYGLIAIGSTAKSQELAENCTQAVADLFIDYQNKSIKKVLDLVKNRSQFLRALVKNQIPQEGKIKFLSNKYNSTYVNEIDEINLILESVKVGVEGSVYYPHKLGLVNQNKALEVRTKRFDLAIIMGVIFGLCVGIFIVFLKYICLPKFKAGVNNTLD